MKYWGEYHGSVCTTTSNVYVRKTAGAGTNACEDLHQHPLHPPHTLSAFLGGSMASHKMA